MAANGSAKRSAEVRHLRQQWANWRAGQFPSGLLARAFCFVIIFSFLIAKSKRFGGLNKQAQAFKYSTLCPICYRYCWH